jgi:predicted CoA-binding protein
MPGGNREWMNKRYNDLEERPEYIDSFNVFRRQTAVSYR